MSTRLMAKGVLYYVTDDPDRVLTVLYRAGLVVVPREPNDDIVRGMRSAASDGIIDGYASYREAWRSAVDVASK